MYKYEPIKSPASGLNDKEHRIYVIQSIVGGYHMDRFKWLFLLILPVLLLGCFQGGQTLEEIDVPKEFTDDWSVDEVEKDYEQVSETVTRELYLIDSHGNVASQTLQLPKLESHAVAEQVLNYLIKDGPVTELLPNGFSAVLPAETEVLGLNLLDDGTLIVDVSEQFSNYEADEEIKIIEAMTYTLTQFPKVERIKLQVNGTSLDTMPVNGTPIAQGYTREKGINVTEENAVDLLESELVTIYYPNEFNHNRYYVPVTQYVEKNDNIYKTVVQTLIDGPIFKDFSTVDVFDSQTMLIDEPRVKGNVLQLYFNEYILQDVAKGIIADEVMETLVRTLTDMPEVDAVEVNVQNIETIFNEHGEIYDKPVDFNMISPSEKM